MVKKTNKPVPEQKKIVDGAKNLFFAMSIILGAACIIALGGWLHMTDKYNMAIKDSEYFSTSLSAANSELESLRKGIPWFTPEDTVKCSNSCICASCKAKKMWPSIVQTERLIDIPIKYVVDTTGTRWVPNAIH